MTLNDTLGVKRDIKHYDFRHAVLGGDAAEEARHPVLQDRRRNISTSRAR